MRETSGPKSLYDKICRCLSTRFMALAAAVSFFLLMLPVFCLSFVNRASGDDYGYGVNTRAAWEATHSLFEVFQAAFHTVRQYYYSWQGTWFSIFCFSLQPEVFSRNAYVIVVFVLFFLLAGSTFALFKHVYFRGFHFDRWSFLLISILYLILTIEFIPGTKSALFWYNGAAHYMIPFVMCQLLCTRLILYLRTDRKRYLAGIAVIMTLLGGSNYQAALFGLIAAAYAVVFVLLNGKGAKKRKAAALAIPMVLETAGLLVSMTAPGNKVRGGEEFVLSASRAFATVGMSFVCGIQDILKYLREKPLVWIGLLALFLVLLEAFLRQKEAGHLPYPLLFCTGLYCLYSAMQAPEIYAGVEVSSGVFNMNYQVFLLLALGILTAAADQAAGRIRRAGKKRDAAGWAHGRIVIPGLLLCVVLAVPCRGNLKQSTTYRSLVYITSGQAADYRKQMDLQTDLLLDETVSEVVVPFINDEQGPLMHMPVTGDPQAWTNTVTRKFYGKESLVAIPREEWMELYGKED